MRITVLGSASGISMPGRFHASTAIEAGEGLYLFDLGEPVGREILARGLPVERLRAAFVSHMHADHVGGLFQLVQDLHLYHGHDYLPHVEEFALGLPAEAVESVRSFLAAVNSFPERLNVRINFLPERPGRIYSDGDVTVTARASTHLDGLCAFLDAHPEYGPARRQAFFFEIEAEGRRVLYSGDLGAVDDIAGAARGADLVVLEFGHLLPLDENLRKLSGLGIQKIVLTHIYPDYTDETALLQETADRVMPGKVVVAEDGLVVEV